MLAEFKGRLYTLRFSANQSLVPQHRLLVKSFLLGKTPLNGPDLMNAGNSESTHAYSHRHVSNTLLNFSLLLSPHLGLAFAMEKAFSVLSI